MRRHTIPLTLAASALALTLTGCGAGQEPAPTATVTVTATPSTETPTASPEVTATEDAPAAETTPAEAETPVAAPTVAERTPAPVATEEPAAAATAELVSSEGMQGDDYMVFVGADVPLAQAQAAAPDILAAKVRELAGTPQAKNIDLVAVQHVSTGTLLAKQPMPGGLLG